MIEITGNNLLSETDYLTFSQLDNLKGYENVTLPLIKDRLEKHPYVVSADVELENQNKTKVILTEKKIMAVVLGGREPYFITVEFQILPLFTNTKFSDLPVISNPKKSDSLKPLEVFKDEDIIEAFKIIDAARLTNKNILKRLSEINLRNGGDIILSFSGVKPPVIYGKGEPAKKMVYLELMWEGIINGSSFTEESDYIDIRFANEIYVGSASNGTKTGLN